VKRGFADICSLLIEYAIEHHILATDRLIWYLTIAIKYDRVKVIKVLISYIDELPSEIFRMDNIDKYYKLILSRVKTIPPIVIEAATRYDRYTMALELLSDPRTELSKLNVNSIVSILVYNHRLGPSEDVIRLLRELLYRYDADPNNDDAFRRATINNMNEIVKLFIQHPKMNKETVLRNLNALLHQTLWIDTLEIYRQSPHLSDLSIDMLIEQSSPNMACEILARYWQDIDTVPVHWRFFTIIYHMPDISPCLEGGFQLTKIWYMSTPLIVQHLCMCNVIRRLNSDCLCQYVSVACDKTTVLSLRHIIQSIVNDLGNYSDSLSTFMYPELHQSVCKLLERISTP
jgi:hypothetical protein